MCACWHTASVPAHTARLRPVLCTCREYRVWDAAEEQALRSGVQKHGLGAWERIRTDPDFHVLL